jgi:hypothetical protein
MNSTGISSVTGKGITPFFVKSETSCVEPFDKSENSSKI